jgi:pyridoxal phosphate enzyme (YggS family)
MKSQHETSVAENLKQIHERIERAATQARRKASDVQLLAVSKTKSLDLIKEAIAAGQHSFGENYVQESLGKIAELPSEDWHFIGGLQSNKAKQITGLVSLIHSVDRLNLVQEIAKAARSKNIVQDILLEVNIAGEATKQGIAINEAPRLISEIAKLTELRLCGLMALPPLSDNEKTVRNWFGLLRQSLESWRRSELSPDQAVHFSRLSMGTSGDFEWAIQEGATLIRVGTSIFGSRK